MANFITVNKYEMINADCIVGFGLSIGNGEASLRVSLSNNTCVTVYSHYDIKRFFEDLFYHFPPGSQPDRYATMYGEFLTMTNKEGENSQ